MKKHLGLLLLLMLTLFSCSDSVSPVAVEEKDSAIVSSVSKKAAITPQHYIIAAPNNNPVNQQTRMIRVLVEEIYRIFYEDYYQYGITSQLTFNWAIKTSFDQAVENDVLEEYYSDFGEEGKEGEEFYRFCRDFRKSLTSESIGGGSVPLTGEARSIYRKLIGYSVQNYSLRDLKKYLYIANEEIETSDSISEKDKGVLYQLSWLIWEKNAFMMNPRNLQRWFHLERASAPPEGFFGALGWGFNYGMEQISGVYGVAGAVTVAGMHKYAGALYVGAFGVGGMIGAGAGWVSFNYF